jgi:hypothetical protein
MSTGYDDDSGAANSTEVNPTSGDDEYHALLLDDIDEVDLELISDIIVHL